MSRSLMRAELLLRQSRFADAEKEVRRALSEDPEDVHALILLAFSLSFQKKHREATEAARRAVSLAPDLPDPYFALANAFHEHNKPREARQWIDEAIARNPRDERYFGLLADIHIQQSQWKEALQAAERGLEIDPENVSCNNLRAFALTQLGRRDEAGLTLKAALARKPENAASHANMGWMLLHRGEPRKAMEHFREALRLEPDMEWARKGILEAMKARNPLYRMVLHYFLWMSRLKGKARWGIVLGAFFLARLARSLSKESPELAPYLMPVYILYGLFVYLTWTAGPLFNLMLRVHPFGKLVLNRQERIASNWAGLCLLLCIGSFASFLFLNHPVCILLGFYFLIMLIPVSGGLRGRSPKGRRFLIGYTAVLAVLPFVPFLLLLITPIPEGVFGVCFGAFVLGILGFSIAANIVR